MRAVIVDRAQTKLSVLTRNRVAKTKPRRRSAPLGTGGRRAFHRQAFATNASSPSNRSRKAPDRRSHAIRVRRCCRGGTADRLPGRPGPVPAEPQPSGVREECLGPREGVEAGAAREVTGFAAVAVRRPVRRIAGTRRWRGARRRAAHRGARAARVLGHRVVRELRGHHAAPVPDVLLGQAPVDPVAIRDPSVLQARASGHHIQGAELVQRQRSRVPGQVDRGAGRPGTGHRSVLGGGAAHAVRREVPRAVRNLPVERA